MFCLWMCSLANGACQDIDREQGVDNQIEIG